MQSNRKLSLLPVVMMIAAVLLYAVFPIQSLADAKSSNSVALSETQLGAIKIEPVGTYHFAVKKKVIGSVAYHEQEAGNLHSSTLPWAADTVAKGDSAVSRSTRLVIANIPESASPLIHLGQPVQVKLVAYPDRIFEGKVFALGRTIYDSGGNPAIDPNTHRITVHCKIADPKNELYPGMLANIEIQVQEPVESVAVPVNGVVRKGDGTMTVWVTNDKKHFEERTVKVGLQQDGYDQILDGLESGGLVATDGAVFLNNMLYTPPTD